MIMKCLNTLPTSILLEYFGLVINLLLLSISNTVKCKLLVSEILPILTMLRISRTLIIMLFEKLERNGGGTPIMENHSFCKIPYFRVRRLILGMKTNKPFKYTRVLVVSHVFD